MLQASCLVSRECAISKGSFGLGRDCSFDLASKRNHAIPPFGNNETKAFCSFFSLFKCGLLPGTNLVKKFICSPRRSGRLRPRGDGDGDCADAAVPCGAGRGPAHDALHLLFPAQRNAELLAARLAHQAGHLCGREARPRRAGNYDAAGPYLASVQRFPDRRTAGSDYGRSVRPPRPLSFCDPHA